MSYLPPSHDAVFFLTTAGGYAPPSANAAAFIEFPNTIYPAWWLSFQSGTPGLRQSSVLGLAGWESAALGAESAIRLNDRPIFPVGIASLALGAPSIRLSRTILAPAGVAATQYGALALDFLDRARALSGFVATQYGGATLELSRRPLYPVGFEATQFGAFHVPVRLVGWRATQFGGLAIGDAAQTVAPLGRRLTQWGEPRLGRSPLILGPRGFWSSNEMTAPNERWGLAGIDYRSKYVRPVGLIHTEYGYRPGVANRNRALGLAGVQTLKFGSGLIIDKGPTLAPPGFVAARFGGAMVALAIRRVGLEGVSPFEIERWHRVRNARRVLAPPGFRAGSVGVPAAANTRRYYPWITAGDQVRLGVPMLGPKVRTLAPARLTNLIVPAPTLTHGRRTLGLVGLDEARTGRYFVQQVYRWITPRWGPVSEVFGVPRLVKATPELGLVGMQGLEFGRPRVQINRLDLQAGPAHTALGRPTLGYRRRRLRLAPIAAPPLGVGHRIDLPQFVPQRVQLQALAALEIGALAVRANQIDPAGFDVARFGAATVTRMGFSEVGILSPTSRFGTPQLSPITLRLPEGGDPWTQWGLPSLSLQSIEGRGVAGLEFGEPALSNFRRAVPVSGADLSQYGVGFLAPRRRSLRLTGVRGPRFGIPRVNYPGVLQGWESLVLGSPQIGFPGAVGDGTLRPPGFDAAQVAGPRIELTHRTLPLAGPATAAYGLPRLSPPARATAIGADLTQWGAAFVAYRVRAVTPTGTDFLQTMRLTRLRRGQPLQLAGWPSLAFGKARTSHAVQTLAPAGFVALRLGSSRLALARRHLKLFPVLHDFRQCGYPTLSHG